MKNLVIVIILLAGGLCSCEKENDVPATDESSFLEISPDSESQVIEKEINGIVFKFCLLNEQGQPATIFKEGENVIFNFSLENNSKDSISIPTQFINVDFYRVYGNDNTDMGKAWTGVWCNFSNEKMIIELPPHKEKQLKCPWYLSDNFQVDYPLCKGESMTPLPRGEYFTVLDFDFLYIIEEKEESIKDITFKINFQIKRRS